MSKKSFRISVNEAIEALDNMLVSVDVRLDSRTLGQIVRFKRWLMEKFIIESPQPTIFADSDTNQEENTPVPGDQAHREKQ